MNRTICIGCLLAGCFITQAAWTQVTDHQAARLQVSPTVRVGDDIDHLPHVEPAIAVNPADPDHLVAASIVVEDPVGDAWWDAWRVHVLVSRDAGSTWTRRRLPGIVTQVAGDPWLAWATSGTLYLSCLAQFPDEQGNRHMEVLVFRSEDGGESWSEPAYAFPRGRSYDHPVLSVTEDNRQATAHIFATGNPFGAISLAQSEDAGQGYSTLPNYQPDSSNNNLGSGVALSEGRLVFSYYSMSRPQPSPLWAVRSSDGGQTYERALITPEHTPVGFPMMAVDRSSDAWRDRIYSVWVQSDAQPNVMLSHSDDDGASWSEPVRVHVDSSLTHRTLPFVAINETGVVAVAWIDGRHHEGDCWDLYATASTDGGATFLPEVRLTPETTCPNAAGNGAAGQRWRWGGDYISIASDARGVFHVGWSDSRTGVYQVWMAEISVQDEVNK